MRDLINRLNQAIDLEYDTKNSEVEETWKMPLEDRVRKGDTISNLTAQFIPFMNPQGIVAFKEVLVSCEDNLSKFREGSPVVLHGHKLSFKLDVLEDNGKIMKLRSGYDIYGVPEKLARSEGWQLDIAKVDIRRIVKKSTEILSANPEMERYISGIFDGSILPSYSKHREQTAQLLVQKTNLNTTQKEAFIKAYSSENYYLIQGPPGTGKTWLLAHLAEAFAKEGKKVLITASTHTAINNALQKTATLTKYPHIIKVGKGHQRDSLNDNGSTAVNYPDFRTSGFDNNSKGIIVGATCYSPHTKKLAFMDWDVIIIDEAAQLSIPLAVAAMVKGKKFIFIGDHKQLPPIISDKQKDPVFNRSVFELLFRHAPGIMLNVTYRMNAEINHFPSQQFYNGALQPHPNNAKWKLQLLETPKKHFDLLDPNKSEILYCHCHYSSSTRSTFEANLVAELVDEFLRCGVSPKEIAIITPFRAQVRILGNILADLPQLKDQKGDLFVDTIERIQGQERDIIIYSLATSNPIKAMQRAGFFYNPNRLNVALTRARKKRIVIGHTELFEASSESESLNELIETFKNYHDQAHKIIAQPVGKGLF